MHFNQFVLNKNIFYFLDGGFVVSPGFAVLVVSGYLCFVKKCGPDFMRNREPYDLKRFMLWYNGLQVISNILLCTFVSLSQHLDKRKMINIYILILLLQCVRAFLIQTHGNIFVCLEVDQLGFTCAYYYLLNKYFDLLETFIFVFRKKNKQISFLHVYHHCLVIFASSMTLQVAPGNT